MVAYYGHFTLSLPKLDIAITRYFTVPADCDHLALSRFRVINTTTRQPAMAVFSRYMIALYHCHVVSLSGPIRSSVSNQLTYYTYIMLHRKVQMFIYCQVGKNFPILFATVCFSRRDQLVLTSTSYIPVLRLNIMFIHLRFVNATKHEHINVFVFEVIVCNPITAMTIHTIFIPQWWLLTPAKPRTERFSCCYINLH